MMRFRFSALVLLSMAACVGSNTPVDPDNNDPRDATVPDPGFDATDSVDAGAETGPLVDAPPSCAEGQTGCDGVCVDLRSESQHCGRCGHDCGGGGCEGGACTPSTFAADLDRPYGVATSPNAVFWIRAGDSEGAVESCRSTGCGDQPPTLVTTTLPPWQRSTNGTIATNGDTLQFLAGHPNVPGTGGYHRIDDVYACPVALCSPRELGQNQYSVRQLTRVDDALLLRNSQGALLTCPFGRCRATNGQDHNVVNLSGGNSERAGFTGNATDVFFSMGSEAVFRRPRSGDTSSLVPIMQAPDATHMALAGDWLVVVSGQRLLSCNANTPCANQPSVLATEIGEVTALVGSATHVFVARGAAGQADGEILGCAMPDCEGGLQPLASGQARPVSMALLGETLFWANEGVGVGAGSIQRLSL